MKISSICSIQNNDMTFERKSTRPIEKKLERPMNMEDKMIMGMKCLAVLGAAAVTNVILKENGIDTAKMAKSCFKSITSNKPR